MEHVVQGHGCIVSRFRTIFSRFGVFAGQFQMLGLRCVAYPDYLHLTTDAARKTMTLLATWNEDSRSRNHYLPAFFESVKNQNIDVVFINLSRQKPPLCLDISQWTKKTVNVKSLCMPKSTLQARWIDHLCHRWRCSELQRRNVAKHVLFVSISHHVM